MIVINHYDQSNIITEVPSFFGDVDEVINICSPDKGGIFVDCTFGGGGYTKKITKISKN